MTALMDHPGQWAEITGPHRYGLGRTWAPAPALGWLGFNPSKADAEVNDQSVVKMMVLSRRADYGGIWVANLFAWRATSPLDLREAPDPVGPENDWWIRRMLGQVPAVVLAWGDNARAHGERTARVLGMVRDSGTPALCLGRTNAGQPRHPCRLAYSTRLESWADAR